MLSTDNIEEENKNFRPWGWYETLILQKSYQVKKIVLYKDQSISLQLHHHRSEHWVVTKGIALVTNNDKEYELNKGESTFIPKKTKHRLKNIGQDDLKSLKCKLVTILEKMILLDLKISMEEIKYFLKKLVFSLPCLSLSEIIRGDSSLGHLY